MGRDLRHSLRILTQAPLFAAIVVLSLALGIGANTAIFSLVNTVMLKVLPVREPERLTQVLVNGGEASTNPIWEAVRDRPAAWNEQFEGLFAWSMTTFDENVGGEKRTLRGMYASGAAFDLLGVSPLIGRGIAPADDRRGGGPDGPVAILSYAFWRDRYDASPSAIGRAIRLDGQPFTIVGVAPPGFLGLEVGTTFDVAVPLATEGLVRGKGSSLDERSNWWLAIMGRLRPGQTMAQADAALVRIFPAVREETMPPLQANSRGRYLTDPFRVVAAATGSSPSRARYGDALAWLMGAVALVLLITCANLANLALARATARERELAVKLALGASRARLIRQLLMESLVLAALGSMIGLLLAMWAAQLLVRALSTTRLPMVLDLTLDLRVLAFTTGIGVLASLLFGLAPAWRATRVSASHALRAGTRSSSGGWRRLGIEPLLVATQIALSLVLVFGAGLFVRSFSALLSVDPGFDPRRMLVVSMDLLRTDAPADRRVALYDRLLDAVRALPDVSAATYARNAIIRDGSSNMPIDVAGYTPSSNRDALALLHRVGPGYFDTLRIPLRAGRDFTETDIVGSRRVAIVNEALARKYFGGANPVGRVFSERIGGGPTEVEIVGLVGDARYRDLRLDVEPTLYYSLRQFEDPPTQLRLLVRARGDESRLVPQLAAALTAVDPRVSYELRRFETQIADSLTQERLLAALSGFFGLLALLVSGLGLYGLLALAVARRRHELGIRLALGAEPKRLVRLVLRDVALITALGLFAGACTALIVGRLVGSLLFGLTPADAQVWTVTIALLVSIAALASYVPARRASRLDPMIALRQE